MVSHSVPLLLSRKTALQASLRYFDNLPAELFKKYMLLNHDLGLQLSETGQFQDILRRPQDYPLLDQPFWLLNDWGAADLEREDFCSELFLVALLQFLADKVDQDIQDETTFITAEYEALQRRFQQDALQIWRRLFPPSSIFWEHYPRSEKINKWQAGVLSLVAVAIQHGRISSLPQLALMADHFISVFQIVESLSTLMIDVKQGRRTLPIQRALEAVHAKGQEIPTFEFVMGALILSGTLNKIVQECHELINTAQILAETLKLPGFQSHAEDVRSLLVQVHELLSMRTKPGQGALNVFFVPSIDLLSDVLAKAEDYLLAEPTFHEAWEVQHYTTPKMPVLIARAFPTALILEILCKHGCDVTVLVDQVLDLYTQNGFSYYTEPGWTPPDADDVGFAIRLSRYSSRAEYMQTQLQAPLRWILLNQRDSGQVPVWFMENDFHIPLNPLSICYGGDCATVEANLMIGLIEQYWQEQKELIESCAHSWCDRWLSIGLGATGHYTPLFSLWTSLELIAKLSQQSEDDELLRKMDAVAARILARLKLEASRANLTPQDASFLILACLCASDSRLPFDPNWLTILYKHQRCDGSWAGEPIYIIPTGRWLSTSWHASRTITTAFCFHALKTYQTQFQR